MMVFLDNLYLDPQGSQLAVHLADRARTTAGKAHEVIADGTLDAVEGPELGSHGHGAPGNTQHSAEGQVLVQASRDLAQQAWHAEAATDAGLEVIHA